MSTSFLLGGSIGNSGDYFLNVGCSQTRFASIWLVAVRGSMVSILGTLLSILALGGLHNREVRVLRKVLRVYGCLITIATLLVIAIHSSLLLARALLTDGATIEHISCDDTDFPLTSSKDTTLYEITVLYLTSIHVSLMYGVAMLSWGLTLLTVSRIAILRFESYKASPAGQSFSDQLWRFISYVRLLPMLLLSSASFWIRPTYSVFLFKYCKGCTRALVEYPFILLHWYKHGRTLDTFGCGTYSDMIARFVTDSLEVGLYLANFAALIGILSCDKAQYSYIFLLMDAGVIVTFPKKVTFLAKWLKVRASLYCDSVFGVPTREEVLAHDDKCVICHEWLSGRASDDDDVTGSSDPYLEKAKNLDVVRLPCHPLHMIHRPCFNMYFLSAHTACNPLRCPICRCDLVEFCRTRTCNTPRESRHQETQPLTPAVLQSASSLQPSAARLQALDLPQPVCPTTFDLRRAAAPSLGEVANVRGSLGSYEERQPASDGGVQVVGNSTEAMEIEPAQWLDTPGIVVDSPDASSPGTTQDTRTGIEETRASRKRKCNFPDESSGHKHAFREPRPSLAERQLLQE